MDSLRKRICYLLARNGTIEMDFLLVPLINRVDAIPEALLPEVAAFLEQEEVDLVSQLAGTEAPSSEVANGATWVSEQLKSL